MARWRSLTRNDAGGPCQAALVMMPRGGLAVGRVPRHFFRRSVWTAKELADTLNLPKTSLPQRVNYVQVEDRFREAISTALYREQSTKLALPLFTIHDGPPFANGDLHIGHALNKMLKDTLLRSKIEQGYRVELRPGWDCHGLPIEQKALRRSRSRTLAPAKLRAVCARFAGEAIERQRRAMLAWGLLADFDRPVLTMTPQYEATQLRVFAKFVEQNLVFMDKRPVYWSPSSETALAEAELEYHDEHLSRTSFVKFPVVGSRLRLLIWTSTPWTLAANQAIALNPRLEYCIVRDAEGESMVVAKSCLEFLRSRLERTLEIIGTISANEILSFRYCNPLVEGADNPVLPADFVTGDVGTGLVHLAPAYGSDDFYVCRAHGIVEREVVTRDGLFNSAAPPRLRGKSIFDEGLDRMFGLLKEHQMLLAGLSYKHRYPYDWRSKKPVIQMVTNQWFIATERIKERLIQALDQVTIVPESGRRRFVNMIEARKDWCISRQRLWGVPIPCFYRKEDGLPVMDVEIVEHVANVVETRGSDAWWKLPISALLPASHQSKADELIKGNDTLDVWFDSGTFWSNHAVRQADVYIEGNDQYRGWFQSSLISSVVATGAAPYRTLVGCGFVVDRRGSKMSKSAGNVVAPKDIIKGGGRDPYGTDILRLWTASSNFLGDVHLKPQTIDQLVEFRQKLRNTFRFILGNLVGLSPDPLACGLRPLDRLLVQECQRVREAIFHHFDNMEFSQGIAILSRFIVEDISAFYFDAVKNRLYLEPRASEARQSCQIALVRLYSDLMRISRPIVPFLAAEVDSHRPPLPLPPQEITTSLPRHHHWECLKTIRSAVLSRLNELRANGALQSTYQAVVELGGAQELGLARSDWEEVLMVSQVMALETGDGSSVVPLSSLSLQVVEGGEKVEIRIRRSEQSKCPRCWIYRMEQDQPACSSCINVLAEDGHLGCAKNRH